MRIAINARLPLDGSVGGVEHFVTSLIRALGSLTDGDEEYLIVTYPESAPALAECLGPRQRVVVQADGSWRDRLRRRLGKWGDRLGDCSRAVRYRLWGNAAVALQGTPGFFESLDADVVHFPFQQFEPTALPSLYNPHDLQHRHLPEFFSVSEVALRERIHSAACHGATAVAAESAAVKRDVIAQYGVAADRVHVVPRGAPTVWAPPPPEDRLPTVIRDYGLPERFCLYPAQFWPHKNHLRLVESLALLRDRDGVCPHLVCTGKHAHAYSRVKRHVAELGLDQHVRFPGYLPAGDLRALYRIASFLVFPSLFEGGGFPVLEAFAEGTPVACSDVTSLPECGGDAVLLFDPTSVESIANAVRRMTGEADLRKSLALRGAARLRQFSWDATARTYRAIYRRLGGRPLDTDDRDSLAKTLDGPAMPAPGTQPARVAKAGTL